jgi:sugar phosphate isomerase/epimerase
MKLGVVSSALAGCDFEPGLDRLRDLGLGAIEIGCGGYHADRRFGDPARLLEDASELDRWSEAIAERGLEISALAIHGAPLSPDRGVADRYDAEFRAACRLAERIGVTRITLLAGIPEGAPGDVTPCWIASAFPPGNRDVLEWQWDRRVVPYWREHARIATDHGCRLCFEMHPNDVVYNPRSFLRLRDAIGPAAGLNYDPSHLFWQGIDTLEALRSVAEHVYHVHAKDTAIDEREVMLNGVLDERPFEDVATRSWSFRTIGFGHGERYWRAFFSALREIGYDGVVSIEHEDLHMTPADGLTKAVGFLAPLLPST